MQQNGLRDTPNNDIQLPLSKQNSNELIQMTSESNENSHIIIQHANNESVWQNTFDVETDVI